MNFTDLQNNPPQFVDASVGRRFSAWFIDSLILCLMYGLVINPLLRGMIAEWGPQLILRGSHSFIFNTFYLSPLVLSLVVAWIYYAGFEISNFQATLGKQFCHLKLVDVQGTPVSFRQASGRYWLRVLVYWGPAFILILGSRLINLALSGAAPSIIIFAIVLVMFMIGIGAGSAVDGVFIWFTVRKQSLHDLIAKTVVVENARSKPKIQA